MSTKVNFDELAKISAVKFTQKILREILCAHHGMGNYIETQVSTALYLLTREFGEQKDDTMVSPESDINNGEVF